MHDCEMMQDRTRPAAGSFHHTIDMSDSPQDRLSEIVAATLASTTSLDAKTLASLRDVLVGGLGDASLKASQLGAAAKKVLQAQQEALEQGDEADAP